MNKIFILVISIALGTLGFSASANAQGTVLGGDDFDPSGSFVFGFAFGDMATVTTDNGSLTGNGNNSPNAFGVTADLSGVPAGAGFAGFGGGFGVFGASLLPTAPASLSDFNISFDAQVGGVSDVSSPISSALQLTFRYPDTFLDGDDGGSDFADEIFRVDVPFDVPAVNGVYTPISVNLGNGTVVTSAGSTPENALLPFVDFVNGDPAIAGRDFSLVNEFLLNFVVNDGLQFGSDTDNSFFVDNVVIQQVVAIPEPSGLALLCAAGVLGLVRRRK